jgi:PAS domain S-box-containing protein
VAQLAGVHRFSKTISRPGIWLLVILFLFITFLQYARILGHPAFLVNLTGDIGLTRYTVERILYLLPIIWASFSFGWKGGVATSLISVACMLPRDLLTSPNREDALVETTAVFIVGSLASYCLNALRKERDRRTQLEAAKEELQAQLQVIETHEKLLAALNKISSVVSQSLRLSDFLDSAVDCVMDVMRVEAAMIYFLDEETHQLVLAAHRGISERFIQEAGRLEVGKGFNGKVAETGELMFVENTAEDPRLTKEVAIAENIRSQLIVPLKSKGKVVGTLCLAVHRQRSFIPEEVDLTAAIGNQIGVAVENARLYQYEQWSAQKLKASEQRYRELFENAHDAIWVHDLGDTIFMANKACEKLTGYSRKELVGMKVNQFLTPESLAASAEIKRKLVASEAFFQPYEQQLVRKDGVSRILRVATSQITIEGDIQGFQHIAQDVTEERKTQENLHFLLQQITRAQEEERKRIARELHDDTIQALVVHSQQIYDMATSVKRLPKPAISRLDVLRQQAIQIMQGLRRLSQDLRPSALDRLGLLPTLKRLAADVKEYSGIKIELIVLGEERRLPAEVELVLFRIVQEGLRNVWKHAQATSAEVTVEFAEGKIRVTVSDNGKGFDTQQRVGDLPRYGKLGLAGMQERARLLGGNLAVKSELGKGTTLIAELPL